jgi:hypothetical protein
MTKQRRSSWTPVIVSNLGNQAEDAFGRQSSALRDTYIDEFPEGASKTTQRQADLRFSIGVALALALPAVIGFGIYEAAKSIVFIES